MNSCEIYLSREINDPKYKQELDEIETQSYFFVSTPFEMNIPHYKELFRIFRGCGVDAEAIVNETEQAIYQRAEYIKEMHQNVLRALGEKNEELRSTENIEMKEKAVKTAKKKLRKLMQREWNLSKTPIVWMVEEGERIYKKEKGEADRIEFEAFKNQLMAQYVEQKMLVAADIVRILTDFTKVPKEMIKMSQRYPRPVNNQKVMSQMELGKKEEKEEGEEEEHPFVDGMVGDKRKRNSSPNSNQPNTPPKKKKSIKDDRKKEDAPEGGSKRKKRKSRKKRHKRHKTLKGKKKKKRKSRKKRHKTLKGKKS